MSLTERLATFFREHPDVWIDGKQLAQIAGAYAWRSRCSDCRQLGMRIDNRVRPVKDEAGNILYRVSEYRYVTRTEQAA